MPVARNCTCSALCLSGSEAIVSNFLFLPAIPLQWFAAFSNVVYCTAYASDCDILSIVWFPQKSQMKDSQREFFLHFVCMLVQCYLQTINSALETLIWYVHNSKDMTTKIFYWKFCTVCAPSTFSGTIHAVTSSPLSRLERYSRG